MNLKDKIANEVILGKAFRGDLQDNSDQKRFDRWCENFWLFKFSGAMAIMSGLVIRSYDSIGTENAQILGDSIQASYLVLATLFALKAVRVGMGQKWNLEAVRENIGRDINWVKERANATRLKISGLTSN